MDEADKVSLLSLCGLLFPLVLSPVPAQMGDK